MCLPGARNETARRLGKAPATFRASAAHPCDGGGGKFNAEEIGHRLGAAILRQQLMAQRIDREGGDPGAVLHGRGAIY
jgi:hypothetical protein